jgi:phosphoribosylaminoimidazolecarboxamide formyltransferase/IMP cyclohydrolase
MILAGFNCAAAKNFKDTVIIASVDEYSLLLDLITDQDGATTCRQKTIGNKSFSCFISL